MIERAEPRLDRVLLAAVVVALVLRPAVMTELHA